MGKSCLELFVAGFDGFLCDYQWTSGHLGVEHDVATEEYQTV